MPHCGGLASLEPRVLGLQVRVTPGSEDAGSSTFSPTFPRPRKASHYGICGSGPQPERTVRSSHPWPVGPIPQSARLPDSTVWLHFLHMLHCPAACQLCCPGQHRHASLISAGLAQRVRGSEGLTLAPRGGSCLATSSCNLFMYLFLCALRGSEFLVHKLAKVVLRALPLHWLPVCRFPTSVLSRLATRAFSAVAFSSVESERQQDPPHR